jgi:phytoene synthase
VASGPDELMTALRAADPDRYLSVLYAPAGHRPALSALYRFNAEIASVRDRIRDALPGEVRLQWWRDAIAADAGTGHPLADALLETIRTYDLPRQTFENYFEARIFDLYDDPMPSTADLEGYCGETAAALIQLAALVLDPKAAPGSAEAAGHAGCAQAMTGLIRLLPLHRARGQCFFPRDLLAEAGTSPEEFLTQAGEGAGIRAVEGMAALARHHLSAFAQHATRLPESVRAAFLPLAPVPAYLARIEKSPAAALRRPVEIGNLRRQWLALRRAMRGWRGR